MAMKHMKVSFVHLPWAVRIQADHHVDVGNACFGEAKLKDMVLSFGDAMHHKLKEEIKRSSSPLSLVLDGSTGNKISLHTSYFACMLFCVHALLSTSYFACTLFCVHALLRTRFFLRTLL